MNIQKINQTFFYLYGILIVEKLEERKQKLINKLSRVEADRCRLSTARLISYAVKLSHIRRES